MTTLAKITSDLLIPFQSYQFSFGFVGSISFSLDMH